MVKERGHPIICMMISLVVVLGLVGITHATEYNVGDDKGWTFGVWQWPNNKTFKPGDILGFHYDPSTHDVAVVDRGMYESCELHGPLVAHRTGYDRFSLPPGTSYFICTFHCSGGVKIAVTAK
ncbi:hypothetical protein Ancab_014602 [Ancistrocladus abbreviatus]